MMLVDMKGNVLNLNIGHHGKGWHINTSFSMEN